MEAGNLGPHFKITSQTHGLEPDANGNMQSVWTVEYETPSGVKSFIKVPDSEYSAAKIGPLLQAKVTEIERVHGLGTA